MGVRGTGGGWEGTGSLLHLERQLYLCPVWCAPQVQSRLLRDTTSGPSQPLLGLVSGFGVVRKESGQGCFLSFTLPPSIQTLRFNFLPSGIPWFFVSELENKLVSKFDLSDSTLHN